MLINAVADPYGWNDRRIWARMEPDYSLHDREVHLNLIRKLRPEGLIVGNSRPQIAFEPENPFFPANTVNASVTHASLAEITDVILPYARKAGPLKKLVVALDFSLAMQVKDNDVNAELAPGAGWHDLSSAAKMLLSFDTLMSSIRIVARAVLNSPIMYGPRGNALPALYQQATENAGGAWALVRDDYPLDISPATLRVQDFDGYFRKLLRETCQGTLDTTIVISPRPAVYLRQLRDAGLWQSMVRWQQGLVAARDTVCPKVKIWDFTAVNVRTSEPPPMNPGEAPMEWFWEMSHAKTSYGRDMLKTVSGQTMMVDGYPLGVPLERRTINAHLRNLTAAVSAFRPGAGGHE